MADLFLSYARQDREVAGALAAAIEHRGITVWWDRTLPPGAKFDEVIEDELRKARCVVVLWSARSVTARWVRAEAEFAAERGVLVPVVIEAAARDMIPLATRAFQYIDISGDDDVRVDAGADAVAAAVSNVLGQPAPAAAPIIVEKPPQKRRWPFAAIGVGGAAVLALVGWRLATSRGHSPEPVATATTRPDPTLRLAVAAENYRQGRTADAATELHGVGTDRRYEARLRLLALDAAAQMFVARHQNDSARVVVSEVLALEPPLVLIAPSEGSSELGRLYDLARKEKVAKSDRTPNPKAVDAFYIVPFQQLSGPGEYAPLSKGLRDMVLTELSAVPGVRALDRENIQRLLDDRASSRLPPVVGTRSPDATLKVATDQSQDFADLFPSGERAFYRPADLEEQLAAASDSTRVFGKVIRARHILTGSFVADSGKIAMSAWMFDIDSAVVDAWSGVSSKRDDVLNGITTLSERLAAQLRHTPPTATKAPSTATAPTLDVATASIYSRALDELDKGNPTGARQLLSQVLTKYPKFEPAKRKLAEIDRRTGSKR